MYYKTIKIETSESNSDFQDRFRWYKTMHPHVTAGISYLSERRTWFGLGKLKKVYIMSANSDFFYTGLQPFLEGIKEITL